MNLRHLELFLAIAERGSVMAGAKASYLSQSTASQTLAALEDDLGVVLFERGRAGAKLTEAGKSFQSHARRILADVRAAREAVVKSLGFASSTPDHAHVVVTTEAEGEEPIEAVVLEPATSESPTRGP